MFPNHTEKACKEPLDVLKWELVKRNLKLCANKILRKDVKA